MDEESAAKAKAAWSFLKNPTEKNIRGKNRRRKAFDKPIPDYKFLVVLDFEWTCDNKEKGKRMLYPPEIIEFPGVLVQCSFPFEILDEFRVYCRPTVNPTLTDFCKDLTAISQSDVDSGVLLGEALDMYGDWLRKNDLVTELLGRDDHYNFAVVTWGDSDIMTTLRNECKAKGLKMPQYFHQWINLKVLFQRHYKRPAKGGLRACVESCGLSFHGRAHSGLVDSRNTAAIVVQMLQQGFRFKRTTRGLGPDGLPWGGNSKSKQNKRQKQDQK